MLPLLFERLMCQCDAMCMIGEDRSYAARFMEWVAGQEGKAEGKRLEAAGHFRREAQTARRMGEAQARKLAEPGVRKEIARWPGGGKARAVGPPVR